MAARLMNAQAQVGSRAEPVPPVGQYITTAIYTFTYRICEWNPEIPSCDKDNWTEHCAKVYKKSLPISYTPSRMWAAKNSKFFAQRF